MKLLPILNIPGSSFLVIVCGVIHTEEKEINRQMYINMYNQCTCKMMSIEMKKRVKQVWFIPYLNGVMHFFS